MPRQPKARHVCKQTADVFKGISGTLHRVVLPSPLPCLSSLSSPCDLFLSYVTCLILLFLSWALLLLSRCLMYAERAEAGSRAA